jgi:hypothetical protein
MEKITCPGCGAPKPADLRKCPYCGFESSLRESGRTVLSLEARPYLAAIQFGIIALVSAAGWLFEDRGSWWSSDTACAIWLGVVPAVACLVGIITAEGRAIALRAIVFFLAGALPFFLGVAIIRDGRINDDAMGLSAAIGGAAAVAFIVGHILRRMGKAG